MAGTQPTNNNFLSQVGAKFVIKKMPNVNYFIQNVSLPSVDVGQVEVATPFSNRIKMPGDLVTYGDLVISFRVDEDLNNYNELYNWILSMTRVEDFEKSTAWTNEQSPGSDERVFSDASLILLNSAMNTNKEIQFTDVYPASLSDLPFTTQAADIDYIECTATFRYRAFKIN
jgi:hypothetical protein